MTQYRLGYIKGLKDAQFILKECQGHFNHPDNIAILQLVTDVLIEKVNKTRNSV